MTEIDLHLGRFEYLSLSAVAGAVSEEIQISRWQRVHVDRGHGVVYLIGSRFPCWFRKASMTYTN